MYSLKMKDLIRDSFKGITPNYVDHSNVIVLNQKCIRNNQIDFSLARFHDSKKTYPSKKELQVGDILINSTGAGTAGRCAFIRELPKNYSVVADSHILVVRISDFFIAGCVQYSLFNIEKLLQTFLDGSTGQGEFDKQRLLNVIIPIPNNPKYIYQFLSNLDKKIALNKQINARLEQMAKTLYDYWFVQFDFPDANGKPYKSSGGEMVFDEILKREIPKGWEVKSLGEIADLYQPATLSEKELNKNGQFLVYGANGIIGKYNKFNHENPVVAVACRGNSCGAINITQPKSWITGNAMVVNPKNKNMCIDFIKNTLLVNNLDKVVSGSAQPQITRTNFAPLKVITPNESLLKLYSDIINPMFNKRINRIQQNTKLTQLRDFLLPMLMNGQVSVAE